MQIKSNQCPRGTRKKERNWLWQILTIMCNTENVVIGFALHTCMLSEYKSKWFTQMGCKPGILHYRSFSTPDKSY